MSAPIQGSNANQALQISTINGFQVKEDPDGLLGFFFNGIEIGRINQQGDASFAAIGVNAGLGISVVGDTISNTGVVSINSSTGTTSITGGTGITVQGLNIINSGVTELQTQTGSLTGQIYLQAGTNMDITQAGNAITFTVTSTTGVASVANTDGSLTISPTTGDVVASLNPAHANNWSGLQTFGNHISFGGAQLAISGLTAGEVLYYNGNNWINREISSTALSSLNGLTGAVTIASSTGSLNIGTLGQTIEINIDTLQANTWVGLQTFGNNISFGGAQVHSSTLTSGDVLYFNGTNWINTPLGQAGVTSVRSSTGTISVDSSTGAVDIEVNVSHANTWTALQTFGNDISFGGAQVNASSLISGQVLYYNGTNWVNETPSSFGVESVDSLKGIISLASPNSSISIGTTGQTINFDINTNNSNDWTGIQTFSGSTTFFTNRVNVGSIYIGGSTTDIFNTANNWNALQTFGNNISLGGATVNTSTLATGQVLYYDGSNWINKTLAVSTTGVASLNTLTGGITIVSSTNTLTVGVSAQDISINLNLSQPNTWTSTQTFGNSISFGGAKLNVSALSANEILYYNGTNWVNIGASIIAPVQSVSNSDGTLTVSPTTGDVVVSLNLSHPNTWTSTQTFGNHISFGGAQVDITSLVSGQILKYNGTNWVNSTTATVIAVDSIKSSTGTLTFSSSTGAVDAEINLSHANIWNALQTFGNNISIGGAKVNVTSLSSSQILEYDGTNWVNTTVSGLGLVDSVQNNDGSLTISPTTGAVVASLNVGHSNTWTANQTFNSGITLPTNAQLSMGSSTEIHAGASAIFFDGTSTTGISFWFRPNFGRAVQDANALVITNTEIYTRSSTNAVDNILDDGSGNMVAAGSMTATSFVGEIDTATLDGISFAFTTPAAGEVLYYNGTNWINREISSTALSSLNGLTGAVTIESTTGELTVGTSGQNISVNLNLAHENTWSTTQTFGSLTANGIVDIPAFLSSTHTWSALQTFGNNISFGGAQLAVSGLTAGQVLYYNGTNWISKDVSSTAVSTINGLGGAVTIESTTGTLSVGTVGQDISINLDLAHSNTWTSAQTFNAGITGTGDLGTLKPGSGVLGAFIAGTGISISNTGTTDVISNAGVLGIGGSTTAYLTGNVKFVAGTDISITQSGQNITISNTAAAGVTSIKSSTGTLTFSSSTGAVDVEINLGHANTWSALQTYGNNISFGGAQLNVSSLVSGQVLSYNGTNWVNATTATAGVSSVTNTDGTLTISPTTGAVVASLNRAHANTWTGEQTFSSGSYTTEMAITNGSGVVGTISPRIRFYIAGLTDANWYFGINPISQNGGMELYNVGTGKNIVFSSTGNITVSGGISGSGNTGNLTAGSGILGGTNTWSGIQTFTAGVKIETLGTEIPPANGTTFSGLYANQSVVGDGAYWLVWRDGQQLFAPFWGEQNNSMYFGFVNHNATTAVNGLSSSTGAVTFISAPSGYFATGRTTFSLPNTGGTVGFTARNILDDGSGNATFTGTVTAANISSTSQQFNPANSYTWSALQTFSDAKGIEMNSGSYGNYYWIDSEGVIAFFGNEYSTPIIDVGTNVTQQNANSNGLPTPNTSYGGGIFRFDLRTSGNPSTLTGLSSNPQWYILLQGSGTAGAGTPIFGVDIGGHVSTIHNTLDDGSGNISINDINMFQQINYNSEITLYETGVAATMYIAAFTNTVDTGYYLSSGTFHSGSDRRLKPDFAGYKGDLISELKKVTFGQYSQFKFPNESKIRQMPMRATVDAQTLPDSIRSLSKHGYYGINHPDIEAWTIGIMQILLARIEELEKKVG